MENAPQLTGQQKTAAFAISGTSLLLLLLHLIFPTGVPLDSTALGLLALAAAPWLTLFFKKFKIPGIGEAETQDRTQGATEKPLPPSMNVPPHAEVLQIAAAAAPSPEAKKVVATLWRYQKQTFGNDTTKRWTFAILPHAPDYARFLSGLSEALTRGWVAVSPENHQCMLTNEGLAYVESNNELQEYGDVYRF